MSEPRDDTSTPRKSTASNPERRTSEERQLFQTNTGELPELLTIRDLARVLKLSPRSIWRLVRNQSLPAPIRIGGSVRWRQTDITNWIAAAGKTDGAERFPSHSQRETENRLQEEGEPPCH